ncbi:hypothetical protein BJX99DRAFT_263115 [Aspergillus californicus]
MESRKRKGDDLPNHRQRIAGQSSQNAVSQSAPSRAQQSSHAPVEYGAELSRIGTMCSWCHATEGHRNNCGYDNFVRQSEAPEPSSAMPLNPNAPLLQYRYPLPATHFLPDRAMYPTGPGPTGPPGVRVRSAPGYTSNLPSGAAAPLSSPSTARCGHTCQDCRQGSASHQSVHREQALILGVLHPATAGRPTDLRHSAANRPPTMLPPPLGAQSAGPSNAAAHPARPLTLGEQTVGVRMLRETRSEIAQSGLPSSFAAFRGPFPASGSDRGLDALRPSLITGNAAFPNAPGAYPREHYQPPRHLIPARGPVPGANYLSSAPHASLQPTQPSPVPVHAHAPIPGANRILNEPHPSSVQPFWPGVFPDPAPSPVDVSARHGHASGSVNRVTREAAIPVRVSSLPPGANPPAKTHGASSRPPRDRRGNHYMNKYWFTSMVPSKITPDGKIERQKLQTLLSGFPQIIASLKPPPSSNPATAPTSAPPEATLHDRFSKIFTDNAAVGGAWLDGKWCWPIWTSIVSMENMQVDPVGLRDFLKFKLGSGVTMSVDANGTAYANRSANANMTSNENSTVNASSAVNENGTTTIPGTPQPVAQQDGEDMDTDADNQPEGNGTSTGKDQS